MQEQWSKSQLTVLPYTMRHLVTCFQTSMQAVDKHLHRGKSNSSSSEDSFLKNLVLFIVPRVHMLCISYMMFVVPVIALLKALAAQSNSAVI